MGREGRLDERYDRDETESVSYDAEEVRGKRGGESVHGFKIGADVEAHSLKTESMNGARGRVMGLSSDGDRISVMFPEPMGRKAVKASNLRHVDKNRLRLEKQRALMANALKKGQGAREGERQMREERAERERQRKAKVGSAFKLDGDDDPEQEAAPAVIRKKPVHFGRFGAALPQESTQGVDLVEHPRAFIPKKIEAMGGEQKLHDVRAILMKQVEEKGGMPGTSARRGRGDSRSRSRTRRLIDARMNARTYRPSLRSPTRDDGTSLAQARAARKAMLIEASLGAMQ